MPHRFRPLEDFVLPDPLLLKTVSLRKSISCFHASEEKLRALIDEVNREVPAQAKTAAAFISDQVRKYFFLLVSSRRLTIYVEGSQCFYELRIPDDLDLPIAIELAKSIQDAHMPPTSRSADHFMIGPHQVAQHEC